MVCVPCFIVPVLLYLWHKFVQPILLKYWNPWEKKDKDGNVIQTEPKNPFDCVGGVCRWAGGKKNATAGLTPPVNHDLPPETAATAPSDTTEENGTSKKTL